MRLLLRRDLVCQQAVELVTDYLEGTLSRAARRRFEAHLAGLPALYRVPGADARDHQPGRPLAPEDLTPQMRDEFVDLYRRWKSEQQ